MIIERDQTAQGLPNDIVAAFDDLSNVDLAHVGGHQPRTIREIGQSLEHDSWLTPLIKRSNI
jgi:hypothetical protein